MIQGEGNLTAFVVGGTGAVGKDVIKALAADPRFTKVTLFGRREAVIPSPTEDKSYEKFEQKIIDFENFDQYKNAFKGHDVGFCTLGTPWKFSFRRFRRFTEDFYKVDHDYVLNIAKLAKEGGTRHFHCITTDYADKNSCFFVTRIKGEVEEDLSNLGFERLSFYRPVFILPSVKREVPRLLETMFIKFYKVVDRKRWFSIKTELFGKAMVLNTFTEGDGKKWEILYNRDIIRVGKMKFKE